MATKKRRPNADYEVGYGRPPTGSRWRKGQSGNPSGKARKEASMRDRLRRLAGEEVVVRRNGAETVMTHEEAMLLAVMSKAMKGDLPAVRFVAETIGVDPGGVAAATPAYEVAEADLAALRTKADWIGLLEQLRNEVTDDGRAETPEEEIDDDDPSDAF